MEYVIFLFAAYGICFGLMNDKVAWFTSPLRKIPLFRDEDGTWFDRLLVCPYCVGFHTGWVVWLGAKIPFSGGLTLSDAPETLLFAFASSAFCYVLDTIIQWFER